MKAFTVCAVVPGTRSKSLPCSVFRSGGEGFCDTSFAPNSGRSQQAIMVFMMGGLVAWTSSKQAFVTIFTAESELVAICEFATCLKSVEHLIAEVMLKDNMKLNEVIKAIHSDSQAA